MIHIPPKLNHIKALIRDKARENSHLEYKSSEALRGSNIGLSLGKEVSALAHSDGGVIIYGIEEIGQFPTKIDDGLTQKECSKEKIEQLLVSNINPRIDGIEIHQIDLSKTKSIYVIEVPRSNGTVHQANDNKYYKRHHTLAMPMEDYEINDVRNRRVLIPQLVNLRFVLDESVVFFELTNIGVLPAFDLNFSFPDELRWPFDKPSPFIKGIKYLAPGAKMLFMWGSTFEFLGGPDGILDPFEVNISYRHPQLVQLTEDTFYMDLEGYRDSMSIDSDSERLQKSLAEMTKKVSDQLEKLHKDCERISSIARPSGLNLSMPTLQNLKRISEGSDSLIKLDPRYCNYQVYSEVLRIPTRLSFRIDRFLLTPVEQRTFALQDIEEITPEIIEKIETYFLME